MKVGEYLKSIWLFFQEQILGMKWLNYLIGNGLSHLGLDITNRWVASLQFFIYDVIKITVLLCVLIFVISYIQSYFPPERSRKILGKYKGVGANIMAALLGTVTPFCSCSSIPLFMGFTSAGLPLGVTFSFLISSPMVDLGSLVLLTSIFGLNISIVYVIVGLIIAVIGGTIIEKLNMDDQVEDFIRNAKMMEMDVPSLKIKDRIDFAIEQVTDTFKKVFPYILIGVGIGALIHNWVPEDWVTNMLGSNNPFGVVIATLIGIPMYADIFGVIPIAEALLAKGAQLGTVLSFMMAVTTLSLPSLILLKKAVKMKLLLTFVVICTIGIIIVGYLFNMLEGILI
ncbi:permease [Macrococcus sp. EM39E]